MSIRITCITKAGGDHENPYVAISRLGCVNLFNPPEKNSSTRQEMYDFLAKGGEAFVSDITPHFIQLRNAPSMFYVSETLRNELIKEGCTGISFGDYQRGVPSV